MKVWCRDINTYHRNQRPLCRGMETLVQRHGVNSGLGVATWMPGCHGMRVHLSQHSGLGVAAWMLGCHDMGIHLSQTVDFVSRHGHSVQQKTEQFNTLNYILLLSNP